MANNAHERVVVLDFGGQYAQLIVGPVLGQLEGYQRGDDQKRFSGRARCTCHFATSSAHFTAKAAKGAGGRAGSAVV